MTPSLRSYMLYVGRSRSPSTPEHPGRWERWRSAPSVAFAWPARVALEASLFVAFQVIP